MSRPLGEPGAADILETDFNALDLETDRRAAGKYQRDVPCGRLGGRMELDGKQLQRAVGSREVDTGHLGAQDTLDPHGRAVALARLTIGAPDIDRQPIEPVGQHDEALFDRPIGHVAGGQDGILEMGRDDLEVVRFECDELEAGH